MANTVAGPMKNIQKRGEPVSLARPCTRLSAYSRMYRLWVFQKNLYAFCRMIGCEKMKIIIIMMNSSIPVIPAMDKGQ